MNNEIKKILREMKEMCEIWVKVDGNMKSYNQDQIHCIYDYITNLQEENERLNNIINELDIEANKNIQVCYNRGFNLISNIDEVKILDDFTFNEYIGYLVSLEILDKLNELKGDSNE